MGALEQSAAHLAKAKELLEAAEVNLDLELFNAATSNAVTSGINSKDAICLRLTGRTDRADNHMKAVDELRAAGPRAATLAPTLSRLIAVKAKSQYQAAPMAHNDARLAVDRATRMFEAAIAIVST